VSEPTRLITLRHGETAWNAEQRIQGQLDVPLNDTGRWQAQRLGLALQDAGIQVVYSSDLSRTADTAAAFAGPAGLPVQIDLRLRERHFGEWQGCTYAELHERWPEDADAWRRRDPGFGPAGGETLTAFHERSIAIYTELCARHPGQVIAVFAHGGLLDSLYRAATHQDLQAPRSWLCANARINRVLYNGEGFSLVGWNDDAHLQGA
jgi:2,3-bisphosphoglycerate-dependent phosphoglycerate mutase